MVGRVLAGGSSQLFDPAVLWRWVGRGFPLDAVVSFDEGALERPPLPQHVLAEVGLEPPATDPQLAVL